MEASWNTKGYYIDHCFFEKDFFNQVLSCLDKIPFENTNDFGSKGGVLEFPCPYHILNQLSLHPKIIKCCQTLLNTDDIRLIQSDVWLKKREKDTLVGNADQRMHMDFPNNYLTHPIDWTTPESVAIIIYFSDSIECGGETAVVPKMGDTDILYQPPFHYQVGVGTHPWLNNREKTEKYFEVQYPDLYMLRKKLYQREQKISFCKGSVLFYRHDLWHRGTPTIPGKQRIIMNLGFKKAKCDYITCWNHGFARSLANKTNPLEKLISKLDNQGRKCLGFPDEESNYWTPQMRRAYFIRYQSRL